MRYRLLLIYSFLFSAKTKRVLKKKKNEIDFYLTLFGGQIGMTIYLFKTIRVHV